MVRPILPVTRHMLARPGRWPDAISVTSSISHPMKPRLCGLPNSRIGFSIVPDHTNCLPRRYIGTGPRLARGGQSGKRRVVSERGVYNRNRKHFLVVNKLGLFAIQNNRPNTASTAPRRFLCKQPLNRLRQREKGESKSSRPYLNNWHPSETCLVSPNGGASV